MTPQMIHWIKMRTALGQLQQLHTKVFRHLLRGSCRMAAVFIQNQNDMPSSITIMDIFQGCLEVNAPVMFPGQKQPMARAQIDDSKDDSLSRPSRRERWKQTKIRFVLGKDYATRWQISYLTQNMPFFSPGLGLRSTHNGNASRHSPNRVISDGVYFQRQSIPCYEIDAPEGVRSSIRWLNIHSPGVTGSKPNSTSSHPSLSHPVYFSTAPVVGVSGHWSKVKKIWLMVTSSFKVTRSLQDTAN